MIPMVGPDGAPELHPSCARQFVIEHEYTWCSCVDPPWKATALPHALYLVCGTCKAFTLVFWPLAMTWVEKKPWLDQLRGR